MFILSKLLALTVWAVVMMLGCSGPTIKHEHSMTPGQGHHPGQTRALLIPINKTAPPPTGLDVADARIEKIIQAHLESKGIEVERLTDQDFQSAVDIAINRANTEMMSGELESVSAKIEFNNLIKHLLVELGSDADLVVVPNVAMRTGNYSGGRSVKWDGVRRRESTRGNMTGTTSVASLYVIIYEPDGTRVFSAYGGLDRIFELSIRLKKYLLFDERLQDVDNLTEGVCISFHPFFGESEKC